MITSSMYITAMFISRPFITLSMESRRGIISLYLQNILARRNF
jgi:hypothetical protein